MLANGSRIKKSSSKVPNTPGVGANVTAAHSRKGACVYLRVIPFHLDQVLVDEGNLLGKAMDSSALPMTLIYGENGHLVYSHQGLISEAVRSMQLERCCRSRH
jgi:hypothetical protein